MRLRRLARTSRNGFVLVTVLVLSVLYFGMLELMLLDSSLALRKAERFRSRTVARTMAENGVELVAQNMVVVDGQEGEAEMVSGKVLGSYTRLPDDSFILQGTGQSTGVQPASARVKVEGRIEGFTIVITRTLHSQ